MAMTSEIEVVPPTMKLLERSYFTSKGWRLATIQEAKDNLQMIQKQEWEWKWERARLLDGWISSPRDEFHIGDDFRIFLGYMLVIQIQGTGNDSSGNSGDVARSIYADVTLTERGRDVALLLCAYDWNYEVVYWLLNSWKNSDTLNLLDVRQGRIPLRNKDRFEQMNRMICNLCRILGEEGFAGQKAAKRKHSEDSDREVMVGLGKSCRDKLSQENHKILPTKAFLETIEESTQDVMHKYSEVYLFQDFASQRDTSVTSWNFLWHCISSRTLVTILRRSLSLLMEELNSEEHQVESRMDFIMCTAILYYLLDYEEDVVERTLKQACKAAAGDDRQRFYDTLKNTSSAHFDEFGNYHVLNTILIYAMRGNNSFLVSKALEWGAQPQASLGPNFFTALRSEIQSNRTENLRILFDKCDSRAQLVNATDDEGKSALHLACTHAKDSSIVEMILQYGGKSDVPDMAGRLPLHYAAIYGTIEIVRCLFDKCQSNEQLVNAADGEGKTSLHLACYRDVVGASIVEMILGYGGKLDIVDNEGRLPLHYAAMSGTNEIVKRLFDKCDSKEQLANAVDNGGMTALHLACCNADVGIAEMVLEYGGKPDVPDKAGRLPLHYAVETGEEGIVDVLIGTDNDNMVTWQDNHAMSPLDLAAKENKIKLLVKLVLVSKQSQESYFDKVDSANLLLEFASQGNSEIVKKLLERGADPRACDGRGRTALHYASMAEYEDKAFDISTYVLNKCASEKEEKILLEHKDESGETALHVAAIKGHVSPCRLFCIKNKEILKVKDAKGRGIFHEVLERSYHDNPRVIQKLLDWSGVQVESIVDHRQLTLLHVASSAGKMSIADALIEMSSKPKVYLRTPDILGQTALHKAAEKGHANTVTVLLYRGAQPFLEKDCDGRTALHCAVRNQDKGQAKVVAELLLKKCGSDEKKLLLLRASAAGLGTADQQLSDDSPLKHFLLQQKLDITQKLEKEGKKINSLKTAACQGNIAIIKELLTSGAPISDIQDQTWIKSLNVKERHNVDKVFKQIRIIAEQGNDKPAISDSLGRRDIANGLAALLLDPFLKPPITVGISGSWGMGKSSLMVQTEAILLKTAAQLALLSSKRDKVKDQEIKTTADQLHNDKNLGKNFFLALKNKIGNLWKNVTNEKGTPNTQQGDLLPKFLNRYGAEHQHILKLLAARNRSPMFRSKDQQSQSVIDSPREGSVPAILTVRYNAWKYRDESEAFAGMAVEITKGMEGIMTSAQWVSTCLRNTWRKQKQFIWIELVFPCLFAVLLAISFTSILWLLLDRYKIKESGELKYASFPITIVIMIWTLVKNVMGTVNPVSSQLMNYMKLPDHTEKLGYQEQVISDIAFLKEEISKKPFFLCIVGSYIWHFITGSCMIPLLSSKCRREFVVSSIPSANLRTIVFVDDIDRCEESVILQVLSAINLVLAVCKISVVLGMDKALIQKAIMNKYGDESLKNGRQLADEYLQKIIQLPLDLPDPSEVQSKNFLNHLGVFHKQIKEGHSESETDATDDSVLEIDTAYNALFSQFERSARPTPDFGRMLRSVIPNPGASTSPKTSEPVPGTETADTKDTVINVQHSNGTNASHSRQTGPIQTSWKKIVKVAAAAMQHNNLETETSQEANVTEDDQTLNDIRQIVFMTYSPGEQNAFDYFQSMVTDIRKSPREWKRLLNYHRLVWNIFLINSEAKYLYGWQTELITWIFICWEWEENMNILIENWGRLRSIKEDKPSLRMIVDHFIKFEGWTIADDKSETKRDTAEALENSTKKDKGPQNMEEDKKDGDPESSNLKSKKKQHKLKYNAISNEVDALNKENAEIKKLLAELKEQVDSTVNQRQVWLNEKSAKEKEESWERLKFALQRFDVSMKGIEVFQRFRFYCVPGYLPWPLSDGKNADK